MKKTLFSTLAALSLFAATQHTATAQSNVKRDVNGNFSEVSKQVATHDSTTTFVFTDKDGKTEPVYKGKKGSFYLVRISKSGNFYRKYLKTEETK